MLVPIAFERNYYLLFITEAHADTKLNLAKQEQEDRALLNLQMQKSPLGFREMYSDWE